MAASDPTPYVATPTGTLQGVAAFSWDGSAWQPSGRAGPAVATPTGVLQGVAAFNGGPAWQPSGRAGPGIATPTGVLDGVAVYTWSGSAWTPPGGTETPSTSSGALRGVAAFNWDGAAWQPVGLAGPSVATPYGVLDGVAMFAWTGSAWAAVGAPSLSLDFMTPGVLDPRITLTRSTTATYFDSTGTMQTAAINAPRWDYDPVTRVLRGLLIESWTFNELLNTASLGTQTTAALTANPYTLSFYGTGTITKSGAATGALVGTGAFPQRVSQTFTPTATPLTCTVTGSVQFAQLELGSLPTSYIPSTAARTLRVQDACSISTASWYNQNTQTLMQEVYLPYTPSGGVVGGLGDGTTFGNSFYLAANTIASRAGVVNAAGSAFTPFAVNKIAGSMTVAAVRCCTNGGAVGSAANAVLPPAATLLAIGAAPWDLSGELSGHMRRLRYWPRVLSDAEMQAMTT